MTDRRKGIFMHPECKEIQALLEKKLIAEPMSSSEEHRLGQHLEDCTECSSYLTFIQRLKRFEPHISHEVQRNLVHRSVKLFQQQQQAKRSRPFVWILAASAAAVILFAIASMIWLPHFSTEKNDIGITTTRSDCRTQPPVQLLNGAADVSLCKQSSAEILTLSDAAVEIRLASGIIATRIDHQQFQKKSLSIRTNLGRIVVKGTVFAVESCNKNVWVHVAKGLVEVIPSSKANGQAIFVAGGNSYCLTSGEQYPIDSAMSALISKMLNSKPLGQKQKTDHEEVRPLTPTINHKSIKNDNSARAKSNPTKENQSSAAGYWTFWVSRDTPNGKGEAENFLPILNAGFPVCQKPTRIECRTRASRVDWLMTGDRLICELPTGLFCVNAEQPDGQCEDYEVRFFCPKGQD
ncbi:MAG: FecR domain-containing protein [Myxococcota bacterium]|nr:FecR domain-containing protein [Myxococcota bacterium]